MMGKNDFHMDYLGHALQQVEDLKALVQDTLDSHADPESPWYNDCTAETRCAWCDRAM